MRALIVAAFCVAAPGPAVAQEAPRRIEIRLSSFDFTPRTIRLVAGRPVILRLVNDGGGSHNFSAPDFFAAARDVTGPVVEGAVEVSGRRSVEIRLTPARGTYRLRCTHTFHTALGMTGEITVE